MHSIFLDFRIKRIDQVECLIARERKQNHALDCEIAALKVNIDERNFAKNYLINENDIITRNERYAFERKNPIRFWNSSSLFLARIRI